MLLPKGMLNSVPKPVDPVGNTCRYVFGAFKLAFELGDPPGAPRLFHCRTSRATGVTTICETGAREPWSETSLIFSALFAKLHVTQVTSSQR
jgi:hypothetical protein